MRQTICIMVVGAFDRFTQEYLQELHDAASAHPDVLPVIVVEESYQSAAERIHSLPHLDIVSVSYNDELSHTDAMMGCTGLVPEIIDHPGDPKPLVHLSDQRLYFLGTTFRSQKLSTSEKRLVDIVLDCRAKKLAPSS